MSKTISRREFLRGSLAGVAGVALTGALGGSIMASASDTYSGDEDAEVSVVIAGDDIAVGGTVTIAMPSLTGTFIFGYGSDAYAEQLRELVYGNGGLMTWDSTGEMMPNFMVESYEVTEDNLEWTFYLKEGIMFSDGTELTANDVLFTYKFYLDESFTASGGTSTPASYIAVVHGAEDYAASCEAGAPDDSLLGIEVIDDYTVKFTLDTCYYTTWEETFYEIMILSEKYFTQWDGAVDEDGTVNCQVVKDNALTKPFGLGPYKLDEYVEGQYARLSINEYFQTDAVGQKPHIETLILKITATEVELDQLLAGDIDLLPLRSSEETYDVVVDANGIDCCTYNRHGFSLIALHCDLGCLQYTEARQAIYWALDRETYIALTNGSLGYTQDSSYSLAYWQIDQEWVDENLTHYTYDPEKCCSVLEEAGWTRGDDNIYQKDGEKMVVTFACSSQTTVDNWNILTANSIEECGIQFNFDMTDFSNIVANVTGAYQGSEEDRMYNGFFMSQTLDPVFNGYSAWHSSGIEPWGGTTSANRYRWVNEENDELMEAMRLCNPSTEEGNAEYQELYLEWVKLINEEAPIIVLNSYTCFDSYNTRIKNFSVNGLWEWTAAIVACWVED